MGTENQGGLRWAPHEVFWPRGAPYLQCTDQRFRFLNLDYFGKAGVLLAMVAPPFSSAMELLGDATMVTARAGAGMVAVKAAKDYRAKIGEQVSISIPKTACHLFDSASGARIGEG